MMPTPPQRILREPTQALRRGGPRRPMTRFRNCLRRFRHVRDMEPDSTLPRRPVEEDPPRGAVFSEKELQKSWPRYKMGLNPAIWENEAAGGGLMRRECS
jgi:hypothetical protein